MKNINQIAKILYTILFLSIGFNSIGQDKKFQTLSTIGISTPILDNGIGFHFGLNISHDITSKLSVEGQISYAYTKIQSSFLSGNKGKSNSVNGLIGSRFYLNSKESKNRIFINLLLGINYSNELRDGNNKEEEFLIGISNGLYIELSKCLFGISYDTPKNLILKMGYSF